MRIIRLSVLLLSVLCPALLSAADVFPRTFKAGGLSLVVYENGMMQMKSGDENILDVQNVWFMNEKWQALPRKPGDVLRLELADSPADSVSFVIRDVREDFLKSFEEKVVLTKNSLSVSVDYEYSADIGAWHFPVYLHAARFEDRPYQAALTSGESKSGKTPLDVPDKVVYGVDGLKSLREMKFSLKDMDLTFSSGVPGWNFCDHRGASWMAAKVFMLLNSTSTKKAGQKEHYDFKISISQK